MPHKMFTMVMCALLLLDSFALLVNIRSAIAWSGTIYIKLDGNIEPVDAPIIREEDCYTLADNITSDAIAIVVERDNIVLDGAGHILNGPTQQGNRPPDSIGILMSARSNVTIKNFCIANFWRGVDFSGSNVTISENRIVQNWEGIVFGSCSGNTICRNTIAGNDECGIWFGTSTTDNLICNNTISYSFMGVNLLPDSDNNVFYGNTFKEDTVSVWLAYLCNGNLFFHNSFMNQYNPVWIIEDSSTASWDSGYPSGGNYWNNHNPSDVFSGPYQNETGSDRIGDTPYIIDANNTDRYPLVYPFGYVPSPDFNNDGVIDILDLVKIAVAYSSAPGMPIWNPYVDLNQDSMIDIFDLVAIAVSFGKQWTPP